MKVRRWAAVVLLAVTAACGSGSGTEGDDEVPAGPEDAGTTETSSTVPAPPNTGGY